MARLFNDAATEYLRIEQAVVAGVPFAITCLFNCDDLAADSVLISIVDKTVDDQYHQLVIIGANNKVHTTSRSAIVNSAITSTTYSLNTWHHACGIWASAADRRAFIDGGSKGTNATSITPVGLDTTGIGRLTRLNPVAYMSGMIAEMAIWDLTNWPGATASDKGDSFERILPSLTKGYTPDTYPLGLVSHWKLIRGLNDEVGGYNLTANGTVVAAHPNIIQPCGVL